MEDLIVQGIKEKKAYHIFCVMMTVLSVCAKYSYKAILCIQQSVSINKYNAQENILPINMYNVF